MPSNLKMVRIQTKIEEMFNGLIDLSDTKSDDEKPVFLSSKIVTISPKKIKPYVSAKG